MTEEQKAAERQRNASRRQRKRASMTEEQKTAERERDASRRQRSRAIAKEQGQTVEQQRNTREHQRRRSAMCANEQIAVQQRDANQHREAYASRAGRYQPSRNALTLTAGILAGHEQVEEFLLGERMPCPSCGALLWAHELTWSTICCRKGKVQPDYWKMPDPGTPQYKVGAFRKAGGLMFFPVFYGGPGKQILILTNRSSLANMR